LEGGFYDFPLESYSRVMSASLAGYDAIRGLIDISGTWLRRREQGKASAGGSASLAGNEVPSIGNCTRFGGNFRLSSGSLAQQVTLHQLLAVKPPRTSLKRWIKRKSPIYIRSTKADLREIVMMFAALFFKKSVTPSHCSEIQRCCRNF
jgi:hypothetical protein